MQTSLTLASAWQQLRNHEITCEEALKLLVNEQGVISLNWLDSELSFRFFREFPNCNDLPPVIPLLLWCNCYYLGSPVTLSAADIQALSDRTLTNIKIIPITSKSHSTWYLTQICNVNGINSISIVNPLMDESEPEDITETTEIYLKKADN